MNQGATVLDLRAARGVRGRPHQRRAPFRCRRRSLKATDTLKRYKERPVIVYGDRGSTAAAAVRTLTQQGFTKVFNLRGGLAAWRAENLPLARE